MRSGARKKGKHGARKLPLDTLRDALEDNRVWSALGVVRKFKGETSHYEFDGEELLIDVEIIPTGEPLLCRWGGGGSGVGIWWIPPEGTEVAVLIPEGDYAAMPTIVGCLGAPGPSELAGLDTSKVIVMAPDGGTVEIHDGSAGAAALATKADLQALADYIATQFDPLTGHTHKAIFPGQTPQILEGTVGSGPTATPTPEGTEVLKAK